MRLKLDPSSYYTERSLRIAGLDGDALRKGRESGELRYKLVGREAVYKGEWLIAWLDRGDEEDRKP